MYFKAYSLYLNRGISPISSHAHYPTRTLYISDLLQLPNYVHSTIGNKFFSFASLIILNILPAS